VLVSGLPGTVNLIWRITHSFRVSYVNLPKTNVNDNLVARVSMMFNFASPGIL